MKKGKDVISTEDVAALAKGNTGEKRNRVAEKLSRQYAGEVAEGFSEEQMKIVDEIFRLLVKDADVAVRKTLSDNLGVSKKIPKDIVLSLAQDMEDIASPVLEVSELLEDKDLVSIIKSAQTGHQKAIAKRKKLSDEVSGALVDTNNADVVKTLLANDGAELGEQAYQKVMEGFSDDEALMEELLTKHGLPETLLSVLQQRVSEKVKTKLEKKYKQNLDDMARARYRERVAVPMKRLEIKTLEVAVIKVLDSIEKNGCLPMINAVCTGHVDSFLTILSKNAKVPQANIKKLYADGNRQGINKLLGEAGIVDGLIDGVRITTRALMEIKNPYRQRMDDIEGFTKVYAKAVRDRAKGRKGEAEAGYMAQVIEHYAEEEIVRREQSKAAKK